MAKQQTRYPTVNFVPQDPFYASILGRLSLWALRVGRYIIIFTEIIVIISFASRFKLDRDLTDLNSSILQKTAIVESYSDTEKLVRSIQKKSEQVTKLLAQNSELTPLFTLVENIPFDVKLSRLGFSPKEIQMNGVTLSSTAFSSFLSVLQSVPIFKEVTIDQIATSDKRNPGIAFSIRLKVQDSPSEGVK